MMIARLNLLQSLPRLASMAAFLCLIVAQWEWPDMVSPHVGAARNAQSRKRLFQHIQFTRHLVQAAILLRDGLVLEELFCFFPGPARLVDVPQAIMNIA